MNNRIYTRSFPWGSGRYSTGEDIPLGGDYFQGRIPILTRKGGGIKEILSFFVAFTGLDYLRFIFKRLNSIKAKNWIFFLNFFPKNIILFSFNLLKEPQRIPGKVTSKAYILNITNRN